MNFLKTITTSLLIIFGAFSFCPKPTQQSYSGRLIVDCEGVTLLVSDLGLVPLKGLSAQDRSYAEVSQLRAVRVRGVMQVGINRQINDAFFEWFPTDSRSLTRVQERRERFRKGCLKDSNVES